MQDKLINMNNKMQLKPQLTQWLFLFLISITFFLSILFWTKNLLFIFVGVFSILYWQRERVQVLLQSLVGGRSELISFILVSILWAFFFETTLQRRNFFITFGFYLPYFLVWYKIFKSRALSLRQVFYLAGLSGALFQLLVTKQIVTTFTQAPDVSTGLLFSILRIASVITFAGSLTTFPFIVLGKEEKENRPKLRMCLFGLASYFIALIGYLVWAGVIKRLLI
ncbi:hypothetical protein ISS86_02075 [Candidatus Microgenomates bacterium]|nr:hypothetical protein [Candidatus Microgenomates bacterium]